MYDPKLCYVLDGFLALYGFIITGMLIKEKVSLDAQMLTVISISGHINLILQKGIRL